MAHEFGQVCCATRLRIVVRAIVLDARVGATLGGRQPGNAHRRGAEVDTSRDETCAGQVGAERILPGDLRRIVGSGSPCLSVSNGVTAGED